MSFGVRCSCVGPSLRLFTLSSAPPFPKIEALLVSFVLFRYIGLCIPLVDQKPICARVRVDCAQPPSYFAPRAASSISTSLHLVPGASRRDAQIEILVYRSYIGSSDICWFGAGWGDDVQQ